MNLTEMQFIASDTLEYFIRIMPDVPFTVNDVVIEFAPKTKMAERARALCARYVCSPCATSSARNRPRIRQDDS